MLMSVAQQFSPVILDITPLGNGLINDTFLVTTPEQPFVLQRINAQVFPNPEHIMRNLQQLNQHLAQKPQADVKLQFPALLTTRLQQYCYRDDNGDSWRALGFIANSVSLETLPSLDTAAQVGFALGHFHRLVSDLNADSLHDTLPEFHIAPAYLRAYQAVLQQPTVYSEDSYCADFIAHHQHLTDELENAKQRGVLRLRVTHGDPKLNNFLFANDSGELISLIDLDTVKPALVHYDIADCLRSCCQNAAGEFDFAICTVLLENYLGEAGQFFSAADYAYLYPAIRLLPFELGLRFYTDYLRGNVYFKVTHSEQNLQRAIEQFELCTSVMTQEAAIKHLIARFA